jgi:transcriptional regulator with XRE-family HTH domain
VTFHAGSLIRQARELRGLSQAQLAELTGMEQPRIAELEGQDSVTTRVLARIADSMGFQIGFREVPRE